MKKTEFLISYYPHANAPRPLERRWNGNAPVCFGRPLRWAVEKGSDGILLRDLSAPRGKTHVALEKKFQHGLNASLRFEIEGRDSGRRESFVIRPLKSVPPAFESTQCAKGEVLQCYVCRGPDIIQEMRLPPLPHAFLDPVTGETAFTLSRVPSPGEVIKAGAHQWRFAAARLDAIPDSDAAPSEDSLYFRKSLRRSALSLLALVVACGIWSKLSTPAPEELIPKQYAKLILTKPAAAAAAPSGSAGHAPMRAKDTAVAQAFRSRNFQRSLRGLLRNNLGKFAVAPSGKAAGALFDSTKTGTHPTGALQGIANAILSAESVAVASMGGGAGYGAPGNAAIAGQGRSFISLDTKLASIDEGLSREEVARVIRAHMSEIRYCYESAMLQNANLEGKLSLDFKIGAGGDVRKAEERESSFAGRSVSDCVIRRLLAWKFPRPRGGVTVSISYPFLFKTLKR